MNSSNYLSSPMEFQVPSFLLICFFLLFFYRCSAKSATIDPTRVTQLSWNPRAFLYKGFLTEYECDHLINLAKDKLERSMVADPETGENVPSEVRTSSGVFLQKHQDEIVIGIEQRIAAWTFLPPENGEDLQVLRYEVGEKYEPHFDFFEDKFKHRVGGHRTATVLMYLSYVDYGGETVFPYAHVRQYVNEQPKDDSWSDCAKNGGYAVKPIKGDALLFFSLHTDANTTDERSLHASCPVIKGEKWSATKWIHVRPFVPLYEDCTDYNPNCPKWAIAGECQRNPTYMVGDKDTKGFCKLSCKAC